MHSAQYYKTLKNDILKCTLCPRECVIKPGQKGFCHAKENRDGVLFSTIYAELSSIALDPIEKKPLYHFYPGSQILSVGTLGCNLRCRFCQNWQIAHTESKTRKVDAETLIEGALSEKAIGIAYTYSEPLIWYEYVLETSKKVHKAGLKNVLVTNGLIHKKPLKELIDHIDAVNLDVKAFSNDFYQKICGGKYLDYIKENATIISQRCHLEVTTLLIPGLNDSPEEIQELAKWLAGLNQDIPLHLTRYYPNYQMDLPPTSFKSMKNAERVAKDYLHYVYLGNIMNSDGTTYCHQCNYPVVKRSWYVEVDLNKGHCPECGTHIPIIAE